MARPTARVDEEKILKTITVVIDEGDARTHGLGKEFLAERTVVVYEADTRFGGDVSKTDVGDLNPFLFL